MQVDTVGNMLKLYSLCVNSYACMAVITVLKHKINCDGSPGKCWFTSACHTCMKCGCHRRRWKCPPVCSMYT
jgi:hypothetical protein